MNKVRKILAISVLPLIVGMSIWLGVHAAQSQMATDPGLPGPCCVISQTVTISSTIQTNVYYPSSNQCGVGLSAPYPAIAFSHGFSMFGFSNGAAENAGNGQHLASWGYVVAIPRLQDDAETRITETVAVINYLETAANSPGSFLYQKVDTARLAIAGDSLGGSTALAIAARDARIKAVVGLDPVYHSNDFSGQEVRRSGIRKPKRPTSPCRLAFLAHRQALAMLRPITRTFIRSSAQRTRPPFLSSGRVTVCLPIRVTSSVALRAAARSAQL